MKSIFFEVPFVVKFLILGFMIWAGSVIQKNRDAVKANSSIRLDIKGKDSIFTKTSVPAPVFFSPQSQIVSQNNN